MPDLKAKCLLFRADVARSRALCDIKIPPAQNERKCHTRKRCGSSRETPIFLALYSAHHGGHKLTQQDDGEKPEAFREMSGVRWEFHAVTICQPRSSEVHRQRRGPYPVSFRRIEK